MSILLIPQSLKGKNFAVFEIDSCCDYSGDSDMLSTNIPDVKITIADNPKEWMAENLGMNEVPLAYVVNGKVTRTFFAQARGLTLKPRRQFTVSTSSDMPDGSIKYETRQISTEEAVQILVENGSSIEEAHKDLSKCPTQWILVNNNTQIC